MFKLLKAPMMFLLISFMCVFIAPKITLANQTAPKEPVPFTFITSKTDDFQPEKEYTLTFAKEVTVNAESVKGAKVNIIVIHGLEPQDSPITEYEEITIGAAQKLIRPIALNIGDNIIEIKVSKEGYEDTVHTVVVKRKDSVIQQSLQNLIVIPGSIK